MLTLTIVALTSFVIGGLFGAFIVAALAMAGDADERAERMYREEGGSGE